MLRCISVLLPIVVVYYLSQCHKISAKTYCVIREKIKYFLSPTINIKYNSNLKDTSSIGTETAL